MLDIKFIRENKELVQEAARKKHIDFDVNKLLDIDDKRLQILTEVENLRSEQNKANGQVAGAKDDAIRSSLIADLKKVKEGLQTKEQKLKDIMASWGAMMLSVPNIPDFSVPEGASDAQNQEVRSWGDIPSFSFEPRSHFDLMINLDMVDFERGAKVSGFRGYFLKNDAVLLNFALWQFALNFFTKKGFTPMITSSLVRREAFMGTGYLPQSEEDLYRTQDGEFLSGTAEVPTMGYFMNEILDQSQLPKKFLSFSPCFRREAGSHGKDTRGLIRVHEFFKFEQVVICEANHQTSVALHEELTANAEEMIQALGLPYHVVVNCGGDLGLGQVKKYDIETWVPSERKYRETHSSSYFHDFQTRRLNIRYKDSEGKNRFAHSLNNTAVATPRILASILECYQQADGSISVPEVLRPYMGKDKISK